MAADSFQDLFSTQAKDYAKFRPHYPVSVFQWVSKLTQEHDRVWDCGTGNGQAALGLAPFFKEVIATDPSEEQLKNAIPQNNITYRIAQAESVPFIESQSLDLVTAAAAAHWFRFEDFYREVNRTLKPGGWIALWTYGHNRRVESLELNPVLENFEIEEVGPFWAPEIQLVRDEYRTIPFPFEEIKAPEFIIEREMNLDQLLGYFSSWSATQKYIQLRGVNPLEGLKARLEKLWGPPATLYKMTWPIYFRVGKKV